MEYLDPKEAKFHFNQRMTVKKVDILSKIDNYLHACAICDVLFSFACTINTYTVSVACFFSRDQQKKKKKTPQKMTWFSVMYCVLFAQNAWPIFHGFLSDVTMHFHSFVFAIILAIQQKQNKK